MGKVHQSSVRLELTKFRTIKLIIPLHVEFGI